MATVYVGLSGGVDSAVAAALLKEGGPRVVGCFLKIWQPEFIECTWRDDRLDAMRVAASLRIPFREIDCSDEYKREVVDSMVADYARGLTPNPDVLCNRIIKFGRFLSWARENGAEYVATGHYARIVTQAQYFGFTKPEFSGLRNPNFLLRGRDSAKDQSYFLYEITQEQLARALFPIGELTKREVRSLAKKFGLPNAEKPDSQGICFLGDVSMEEFLGRFVALTPGPVLDMTGATIGEHHGAALYTLGQRHGFTVQGSKRAGGVHYIVSADTQANMITVSRDRLDASRKEIGLERMHWINTSPPFPIEAEAQARYREIPVRVRVEENDGEIRIIFSEPHLVSPGQSLVLYERDRCLGGGTISRWSARS